MAKTRLTYSPEFRRWMVARGHWAICGTPERIADILQEWFENDAADGFNILPPYFLAAFGTPPCLCGRKNQA